MDTNALRGYIAKNGMTQDEVAKRIGMGRTTFWRKMKSGNFGLSEANELIRILKIDEPNEIFFSKN